MEATLKERVNAIEKQLAELSRKVAGSSDGTTGKNWRSSVGMLPRDEISAEADRLGQEWRARQTEP